MKNKIPHRESGVIAMKSFCMECFGSSFNCGQQQVQACMKVAQNGGSEPPVFQLKLENISNNCRISETLSSSPRGVDQRIKTCP